VDIPIGRSMVNIRRLCSRTDVEGDDDVDQTNHCWMEQNMAREGTDVGGGDAVDQMNHCWMVQNMAGEDTGAGGDDDVDNLDEML
jgi:tryptophan 2,3-dioxygenase